jgi:hypothetical protein
MDIISLILGISIMILFGFVWVIVALWWIIIPVIIIVILVKIKNQGGRR